MTKYCLLIVIIITVTACQTGSYKNDSYDMATQKFVEEEYSQALLYYNDYITRNPKGPKSEDALFGIIKCMVYTNNRVQLESKIKEYQNHYPEGKYIDQVNGISQQIEAKDTERKEKMAETVKNWKKRYEELKLDLSKDPQNPNILLNLGHLAWNLDYYEEATEFYKKTIEAKPSYLNDSLLQSRVEFDTNGNMHAKIPSGIAGSDLTRLGVRIRDTNSYYKEVGGRDTGVSRIYVLTGTVINETTEVIPNLLLQITTYTALNKIIDSKTITIGQIAPLQKRSFVMESSNFEFFHYPGVDHYEIEPIY